MAEITKHQIGRNVKTFRESAGRSQEDLAGGLGIPRPSFSQIERGERDLSSIELAKLSELLGITMDEILMGPGTTPPIEAEPQQAEPTERVAVPRLQVGKFKEVLLYILENTSGKVNVGETVLYKLLYFADFNYYEKHERQLTGAQYIKNHYGPTPVAFRKVVEGMIKNKELAVDKNKVGDYDQTRYVVLRKPDLTKISGAEKEMIDSVIDRLSDMSARQISQYSHGDTPWSVTKEGRKIDYETVFYRSPAYSVRDYEDLYVQFAALPEFDKDLKRLRRKYPSLPEDLETRKSVLAEYPEGRGRDVTEIPELKIAHRIFKARLMCRSLKGASLRLIYCFDKEVALITFIEVYYKGDKELEDRARILNNFR